MTRYLVAPKISLVAALALLVSFITAAQFAAVPHAARAHADTVSTGSAGLFVPNVGRLMDTRNGTGGYSTPMPANVVRSVPAAGVAGIPSTGVSALALTLTVLNPSGGDGTVTVAPGDVTVNQIAASIAFTSGDSVSNTSLVALHSDGHINVVANTAVNLIVDVQGYFTSGTSTAAGGFVPVNASRVADTATGLNAPQTKVANNASIDVQITGVAGVPASATSVYVNLTASGQAAGGYLRAYPTGGTVPTVDALDFDSSAPMAQTAVVKVGTGGKITVLVPAGGPVNIAVDIQGYFTAGTAGPAFTPAQLHYYDSRQSTPLASNEVRQISVTGVWGVPTSGSGLTAIALDMRTVNTGTAATGWIRAWPNDQTEPTSTNISYGTSDLNRSNVAILTPGADGKISVRNGGNGPIDLVLDVEGWFSVSLPAAHGAGCSQSGDRAGAKSVSHALTDRSKLTFSPVTGDLLATGQLLHVAGVDQDDTIVWRYNPVNDARPTLNVGYDEASLKLNADSSLTYTAPDGGCYTFPNQDTSDWGPAPAGINAWITSPTSGTYDLTFYPSGLSYVFTTDADGNIELTTAKDKYNGTDTISYAYANGHLVTITDTRGNTVSFVYTDPNNPTQPSEIRDHSLGRTIDLAYNGPAGALTSITDATGAQTTFGYDTAGRVNSITDDRGTVTTIGYGTGNKATSWTYAAGTSDASAWTASYTAAQTTVTDPNSHTTTYDVSGGTVTKVTDGNNHATATTFDSHDNELSSTTALGNQTSYTWGSGNNMMTSATSPSSGGTGSGASVTFTYPGGGTTGNGVLSNYQPSSSTDSQNNTTGYQYSSQRDVNMVATNQNAGGTPTFNRQGDSNGTSCSAFPGELCNSTNGNGKTTSYAYDGLGRITTLTQPSPLGAITFTYDGANRVTSATDGRGNTAYYSYDADDRITQVSHSATSCPTSTCVSYTYDGDGNKTGRVDSSGTTTYGYDRLNRPTSKKLGAATLSTATYDGASNMTSYTDAAGTVTYQYDAGNQLRTLAQPGGSCPSIANIDTSAYTSPNSSKCTRFVEDNDNRRNEVDYPNGQKILIAYYNSGTIHSIKGVTSGGGVLAERDYTYTNTTGGNSGLRDSMTDPVAGATVHYRYDGVNRLTNVSNNGTGYSATYDKDGNRTSLAQTGQANIYAAYNDADELCWTGASSAACTAPPTGATNYTYDTSGNQTAAGSDTTTVNVFNQDTSIQTAGVTTNFTYADTSNTERITSAGTNFLNGTLGITAQTTSGTTIEYTRDPAGNLIAMTSGGSDYYYTTDAIGSVILITSPTQTVSATYSYNPWGLTTQTGSLASSNPWRFAGGYYDTTTGLTKMGARYYNPTTGRFTQPDPSHQETNNYAYAGDDPINNSDPTGLDFWDTLGTFGTEFQGFVEGVDLGTAVGFAVGFALSPVLGPEAPLVGAVVGADLGAEFGTACGGIDGCSVPQGE